MKLYNKFLIGCLALGALSACTDRFESMNTDPSSLVNVSPAYILPFVQETGVNLDATPYQRGDNLHSQMYCQYFTNTVQGWTSDRYGYNDGWAEPGYWTPYYTTLKHLKEVKAMAAETPSYTNYCQMVRITVAYGTIGMTDTFGDIPYSEAGLGGSSPKYDVQKNIYPLAELKR